ncbi:LysR family transcriptional regulator [Polyangium sorediatum]|uniref:LysR family transcriptional regulator n=1 Tax=Polyangium sorediatum TaxID=889274 RepID=A0ABT6NX19_9BACT|nr:LysR family transcriptional regulator [Polyangium sorediatum]MDI1432849.1 LysR family transcriptional regulator [Polyangium sorediatum]
MDFYLLRSFQEVARRGSITAAARSLGVSQPSLTLAMQRLERELGTTLLHRGRSGVALTETGLALARDVDDILAMVARTEQRIRGLEEEETGRFVVGCHESLGAYFLPAFMQSFLVEAPGIELTLWNGSSAGVRDAVVAREVHFGVVVNPSPHPDLVLVRMFEDAVDFFTAESPARTLSVAYDRIRRGPLVHAKRVTESQALIIQLEGEGVVAERELSCGDFELVKTLVLEGIGIGILPRRVAAYGAGEGLVRLHPDLPHFDDAIHLVYRGDLHKTRGAMRLKDALVAHGKALRSAPRSSTGRKPGPVSSR